MVENIMKKADVQRIVETNIEGIQRRLGLESWKIVVEYSPIRIDGDDTHYPGMCNTDPELFQKALITLDPEQHNNSAEVLYTLEHELCHCIGSNFDICQAVLARLITKREYKAVDVLFRIAHEQTVASIQSILSQSSRVA